MLLRRSHERAQQTTASPRSEHAALSLHDLDGMLRRLHLPTVRRVYADLATRAWETA